MLLNTVFSVLLFSSIVRCNNYDLLIQTDITQELTSEEQQNVQYLVQNQPLDELDSEQVGSLEPYLDYTLRNLQTNTVSDQNLLSKVIEKIYTGITTEFEKFSFLDRLVGNLTQYIMKQPENTKFWSQQFEQKIFTNSQITQPDRFYTPTNHYEYPDIGQLDTLQYVVFTSIDPLYCGLESDVTIFNIQFYDGTNLLDNNKFTLKFRYQTQLQKIEGNETNIVEDVKQEFSLEKPGYYTSFYSTKTLGATDQQTNATVSVSANSTENLNQTAQGQFMTAMTFVLLSFTY